MWFNPSLLMELIALFFKRRGDTDKR